MTNEMTRPLSVRVLISVFSVKTALSAVSHKPMVLTVGDSVANYYVLSTQVKALTKSLKRRWAYRLPLHRLHRRFHTYSIALHVRSVLPEQPTHISCGHASLGERQPCCVVSPFAHGEVVGNAFLHGNKAFFLKLDKCFRRTLILAAEEEMSLALRESKLESYPREEKDHLLREFEKFTLLARPYKRGPRDSRSGASRPHDSNDDNDDNDEDGGPGRPGHKIWSLTTLSSREKQTVDRYPAPTRNG